MPDALVYRSQANASLTDAELEVILIRSRTLNELRGITGALIKGGCLIVQYLEGDAAAIERTFASIAASPHHGGIQVGARASGVVRQFDRWHMGFRDFQPRHQRMASTEEWMKTLEDGYAAAAANAPLAVLTAQWRGFRRAA